MFGKREETVRRNRPDSREHSAEYHITTLYPEQIANRKADYRSG